MLIWIRSHGHVILVGGVCMVIWYWCEEFGWSCNIGGRSFCDHLILEVGMW